MIFFIQECVCHRVIRSRRGTALFCAERKMSTGQAARTMALCFMGKGLPSLGDAVGHNCSEEAQPPETNHESARWMELGIRRCRGPVRFGRRSSGGGTLCADYGSSAATGIGARDATEMFGFWLLIHADLKHELARRFLAALRNPVGLTTHSRLRPRGAAVRALEVLSCLHKLALNLREQPAGLSSHSEVPIFWNYFPSRFSYPRKMRI